MYLRECVLSSRHAVGRREDNNLVLQQHSFECVLVCVGIMFGFSKNIYFVFDNECQLEEAGGGTIQGCVSAQIQVSGGYCFCLAGDV